MSKEIIRLRVPENPKAEFVAHGNLGVELKPGQTVETPNRRFADALVAEYDLEEIETVPVGEDPGKAGDGEPASELGYPADFPGREHLIAAEVPHATAVNLSAEQLAEYKGIGPKSAEVIRKFVEGGTE
jgi:hypothetical protein